MAGTTVTWVVEPVANEAALETRLNALRLAATDVRFIIWNGTTNAFTIVYLEPV